MRARVPSCSDNTGTSSLFCLDSTCASDKFNLNTKHQLNPKFGHQFDLIVSFCE